MPKLDLEEEDEVLLALNIASGHLRGEQHKPIKRTFSGQGCSGCDTLWFIANGLRAYRARMQPVEEATGVRDNSDTGQQGVVGK